MRNHFLFNYLMNGRDNFPFNSITCRCFQVVVYACVCLRGVIKGRPGALHNKDGGSAQSSQQCERDRGEMKQLKRKGLSPLSRLIKERICSKQLYLNLSCLLLAPPAAPLRTATACKPINWPMWSAGFFFFMHWRNRYNKPKGGKGHRSNGDN